LPATANAEQPVTDSTPLAIGDNVRVQRGRESEDAVIVELLPSGIVRVEMRGGRFAGTPMVVPRRMLRLPANSTPSAAATAADSPPPTAAQGQVPDAAVGVPVTAEMRLVPGTPIQAHWGNSYWYAEVAAVQANGDVKVHYLGWSASSDEVLPRSKLRIDRAVAAKL
jgi:sRNA-binding protein